MTPSSLFVPSAKSISVGLWCSQAIIACSAIAQPEKWISNPNQPGECCKIFATPRCVLDEIPFTRCVLRSGYSLFSGCGDGSILTSTHCGSFGCDLSKLLELGFLIMSLWRVLGANLEQGVRARHVALRRHPHPKVCFAQH